jgi:hypothetical protein
MFTAVPHRDETFHRMSVIPGFVFPEKVEQEKILSDVNNFWQVSFG